jgi:hypothetical protein
MDLVRAYGMSVKEAADNWVRAAESIAAAMRAQGEEEAVTDLVEFVRACLDDDERVARFEHHEMWGSYPELKHLGTGDLQISTARVLAEVAAKRAILDVALGSIEVGRPLTGNRIVRLLAQPFAGRTGWREEWASLPESEIASVDAVDVWDEHTGESVYSWRDPEVWKERNDS